MDLFFEAIRDTNVTVLVIPCVLGRCADDGSAEAFQCILLLLRDTQMTESLKESHCEARIRTLRSSRSMFA